MADDSSFETTAFRYEHARRQLPSFPTPGLGSLGNRTVKPLLGGLVAFGIITTFLAVRGGEAELFDEVTGQKIGGWSRLADVHLLIVVNTAIVAGLAAQLLAEYTRHWTELWLALLVGGTFVAISEATDIGRTASDVLLGLGIASFAAALTIMLADARTRKRTGY